MMKWKDFFDNWEEIFVGTVLQFPIYFIVKWWVLPIMLVCGILWRNGGTAGGVKWARWAGVPLVVCFSSILYGVSWWILLAAPFMLKLNPFSYGKDSWLYKWTGESDFLTRIIGYAFYWLMFSLAFCL